ncbi:FUSC family protein [Streptomyces sp. NPDC047061]|uniref:FUSC family protein n=1 Tax=Streptomyces sp. NPDC047061 TaxID=3154605 RepID=UPI0033FA30E8
MSTTGDRESPPATQPPPRQAPPRSPLTWLFPLLRQSGAGILPGQARTRRGRTSTVSKAAVVRAAIATALALALGLATGGPAYGALAAMGALNGITSDTETGYRRRMTGIVVPQGACVVGLTVGSLVYGGGWLTIAVVTFIALLSGAISSLGRIASACGLLLLLNTVVGAGLPLPEPWWLPPLLMTGGTLLFLALALIAWPLRPWAPERRAVANAYRAVATLLASCAQGTSTPYEQARRALTHALNQAYDLLLAHGETPHGRIDEQGRLTAQLNALAPLIEAAPLTRLNDRFRPGGVPAALRALADMVEAGSPATGRLLRAGPLGGADQSVLAGLHHAAGVIVATQNTARTTEDGIATAPASASGSATRRVLAVPGAAWRYGVRLALCIGLAQAVISLVSVPRSYWVPLTVTFVLKPDFGSVFSRAVLRIVGTVPGLAVAAAVFSGVPRGWWDVPVVLVLGALVPALTPLGYGHQTAAITPLILLLSDMLSHQGSAALWPRLLDSAIGCAITLIAGYLLWPESWHTRVGAKLADTVEDCARYLERSFTGAAGSAAPGHLRRSLYRDLSAVRMELEQALIEPPPTGRTAAAWWPILVFAERVVDVTTAMRTQVAHGCASPCADGVAEMGLRIRRLAVQLRQAAVPSLPPDLPGFDVLSCGASVMEPLQREVAAMEGVVARHLALPTAGSGGTQQH